MQSDQNSTLGDLDEQFSDSTSQKQMGQNFSSIWENCLKRDKDQDKKEPEPEPITEPYPSIDPQTIMAMRPSEELLEAPESIPSRPWSDSDLDLPLPPRSIVSNRQSILLPHVPTGPKPNLIHLQNRLQVTIVPEPVPKPRSNNSKYLFAGKRFSNSEGTSFIFLISPKTTEIFKVPEDQLKEWYNIVLGDFLTVKIDESGSLYDMEKAEAIGKALVKVDGDTAYILNVPVKLVYLDEKCVFQCAQFADAVSRDILELRNYFVRISMLSEPVHLSDGKIIFFEGTNPKQRPDFHKKPEKVPKEQKTDVVVVAEAEPQKKIYGAGFEKAQEHSESKAEIEDVSKPGASLEDLPSVQSLMEEANKELESDQKDSDKAGSSIIPQKPKKKQQVLISARAVFLDDIKRKSKHPIRLLWVLDHNVEARMKMQLSPLPIGHFFQGLFKPHPHFSGQLLCVKYEKKLEVQIPWSLDETGKICLIVKLENVKEGEAEAEGIGRLVDGETENTKISPVTVSNGKLVKIQRVKIDETLSVWRVVEIL